MSVPITAIQPIALPQSAGITPSHDASGAFHSMLNGMIGGVEQANNSAQQAVNSFLSGNSEELHSVALATQRADLEFDMFLQVRNKVVSAYQEVMKMQL